MSTYWEDILTRAPDVLWKGDEADGAVVADASGSGYPGVYVNTPTLGQPSLLAGEPLSLSVLLNNAQAEYLRRFPASDAPFPLSPTTAFTALLWINPTNLAGSRDVMGMVESWQLWIDTTGLLTFHATPPWTSLNSTIPLVAGVTAMVAVRKTPTQIFIFINGVQRGVLAHASPIQVGNNDLRVGSSTTADARTFHGLIQGFAYWAQEFLTDEEILAFYTKGISAPPVAPVQRRRITLPGKVRMYTENIPLITPTQESPGPARTFGDLLQPTVQVLAGEVQLQVSNHRGNIEIPEASWEDWDAPIAVGVAEVTPGPRWIRATSAAPGAHAILTGLGG